MFQFSKRSWDSMTGVDPRLVALASRALAYSEVDFTVIEGLRTRERQAQLVAENSSWTMNSKHLTGRAIDVMAWAHGDGRWEHAYYHKIIKAFRQAADELNVPILWGGDWKSLDMGHIELA
jgi:peptidoglycan L-alanyl-D-glutamate endopeptidase CwlK